MKYTLRLVSFISLTSIFILSSVCVQAEKLERLVLSGPSATVSNPLIYMIEKGYLDGIAKQVEFKPWRTPDQLRAMAVKGEAQVLSVPSNVAANLYNRGVKLKLLNISIWGILWIVSTDESIKTLKDLKDQELYVPYRGDMPDIVLHTLAKEQGLNLNKDVKINYMASPMPIVKMMITRRADNALLPEPAISMAIQKSKSFPAKIIAPDLRRAIDLQKEWGATFKREPKIPQAGVVIQGAALKPEVANVIQEAYERAAKECSANPVECAQYISKRNKMLTPEAVAESIKFVTTEVISAQKARSELEFFYTKLMQFSPELVGKKLPDNGFYYSK